MKRWALLLLVCWPAIALGQGLEERTFLRAYDLDSTTLTYCVSSQLNTGIGRIKTSGSSTTVTTVTAGQSVFAPITVGDTITVNVSGTEVFRTVTAKASDTSITVNAAVDLENSGNGYPWSYRDVACGTGANDGWLNVAGYKDKVLTFGYDAGDATDGVDVRWECKTSVPGANPVTVYPGETDGCGGATLSSGFCNFATASVGITNRLALVVYEPWAYCRIGIKIRTADASDAGANLESIDAGFNGSTK